MDIKDILIAKIEGGIIRREDEYIMVDGVFEKNTPQLKLLRDIVSMLKSMGRDRVIEFARIIYWGANR